MMLRDRVAHPGTLPAFSGECDEALDPLCAAVLDGASARRGVGGQAPGYGFTAPTAQAEKSCVRAGYLCAELDQLGYIDIRRWSNHEGTIVVHVPLPPPNPLGTRVDYRMPQPPESERGTSSPFPCRSMNVAIAKRTFQFDGPPAWEVDESGSQELNGRQTLGPRSSNCSWPLGAHFGRTRSSTRGRSGSPPHTRWATR